MIGKVVNDGRLFSLRAAEWLILIAGGLAGSLILMFRVRCDHSISIPTIPTVFATSSTLISTIPTALGLSPSLTLSTIRLAMSFKQVLAIAIGKAIARSICEEGGTVTGVGSDEVFGAIRSGQEREA